MSLRILAVNHEFPPVGGGGGKVTEEICTFLAHSGHQVLLITSRANGLPDREDRNGFQVKRVFSLRKELHRASFPSMGAYLIAGLWRGFRIIRRWRPDVIHAYFAVPGGALAWALSRLTGVPYVVTAVLGDVPGGVPEKTSGWFRWIRPLTPRIWKDAAQVVAISDHTRDLALAHYPVDIRVIPNAIHSPALDPEQLRTGNPPHVVFAGRFQPQKNPLMVVRVLDALREIPWTCTMIGDGPLYAPVEEEISRLGLDSRIQLAGWVPEDEVFSHFGRGDILFMPSLTEALPVVGLMALGMGLAIVASRISGVLDFVEEGVNGYLERSEDQQAFEAALRRLLTQPDLLLRFRRKSREMAGKFDIQEVGRAYEQVFYDTSSRARDKIKA